MWHISLFTLLVLSSAPLFSVEPAKPRPIRAQTLFDKAKQEFSKNNCKEAITSFNHFLDLNFLDNKEMLLKAHEYLAICYYHSGDQSRSKENLKYLLYMNPNFKLDPFSTPPIMLQTFGILRKQVIQKTSRSKAVQISSATMNPNNNKTRLIALRETSWPTAFLPLGISQISNGQLGKGLLIGSGQLAFLGLNIGAYWWKRSYLEKGSLISSPDLLDKYNQVQTLQWISLGIVVGIYTYSIVDAFINQTKYRLISPKSSDYEAIVNRFEHAWQKKAVANTTFSTQQH